MSKLSFDTSNITSEVYAYRAEKSIYYVKLSIPDLKLYINSISVRPSTLTDDLWVQMPAFCMGRRWVKPIEFSADSELQAFFTDAALRAVDDYNHRVLSKKEFDETKYSEELSSAYDSMKPN